MQRDVFGVHHAAGGVIVEFQQLAHFARVRRIHLFEDLFRGLVFQLGKRAGSFVGRHFFDDVGGLLGLEGFEDAGLHLGIDLGKRIGGSLAIDGFEDGFALGRAEIFDDIGEIGGMHLFQAGVRDIQAQAA